MWSVPRSSSEPPRWWSPLLWPPSISSSRRAPRCGRAAVSTSASFGGDTAAAIDREHDEVRHDTGQDPLRDELVGARPHQGETDWEAEHEGEPDRDRRRVHPRPPVPTTTEVVEAAEAAMAAEVAAAAAAVQRDSTPESQRAARLGWVPLPVRPDPPAWTTRYVTHVRLASWAIASPPTLNEAVRPCTEPIDPVPSCKLGPHQSTQAHLGSRHDPSRVGPRIGGERRNAREPPVQPPVRASVTPYRGFQGPLRGRREPAPSSTRGAADPKG